MDEVIAFMRFIVKVWIVSEKKLLRDTNKVVFLGRV